MIRLLIVDDDAIFRAQLRGMTNWDARGICIDAEARNGREAIEQIARCKPDVILTDVNMPVLNGVGLIEHVKRYYPKIPVIALSAYDDYEYVRDCLKSGAQDYLLKHKMNADRLLSVLTGVVRQFHIQCDRQYTGSEIDEFYFLAVSGWFQTADRLMQRAQELDIVLPTEGVYPVLISPDHPEKTPVNDAMFGMLCELTESQRSFVTRLTPERVFLLYPAPAGDWPAEPYRNTLQLVIDNFRRFFDVGLSCGVGGRCRSLADLSGEYRKACQRYEAALFAGQSAFISGKDEALESPAICSLESKEERVLNELLRNGNPETLTETLDCIFEKLQKAVSPAENMTFAYAELVRILLHAAKEHGVVIDAASIPQLSSFHRIGDIHAWCRERYLLLQKEMYSAHGERYSAYTCKAIEYMRKHFGEPISLSNVAEMLSLNASYLSRRFKAETGEKLMTYLHTIRMEEACKLLRESDLPIKEIAGKVGIQNYNHFFTLFRRKMGLTPNDFRQQP